MSLLHDCTLTQYSELMDAYTKKNGKDNCAGK